MIFSNENYRIVIQISVNISPKRSVDKSPLVQVKDCRQPGDKPF